METGVKGLPQAELKLDRCVRGKALRHSFAHLQADRSSELNQFCVSVALAESLT